MSFSLSPDIDKNKFFLVRQNQLTGRLDPSFYKLEKTEFFETLKRNSLNIQLKKIAYSGSYGILPPGDSYDDSYPILFLRATELLPDLNVDFESVFKVSEKYYSHKRSRLKDNDILIAVKGATIASKKCIAFIEKAPERAIINGSIFRFQVKEGINPKFIAYMLELDITKRQMKYSLVANNAVDYLDKPLLRNLLIFVPKIDEQSRIVTIMDVAYADKRKNEAKAQRLLDSIDNYLLGELGVELAETEESTIQNRIFIRKLSEVSDGRFDAPIHYKEYSLETSKYPMVKLKDCVFINPATSFCGFKSETMATFIPMERVSDQYGEADISECRSLEESGGYTKFHDDDLLWAKITPCMQNGKSAVVSNLKNSIGFGSTEFHVFRAKHHIDIRYIHAILRLRSLRNHAVLFFSGSAGHQRVADEFFKRLSIPKLPIEKQTEIANHINDIQNQAKQIKQLAKAELEQAKKAVEAMILGKDDNQIKSVDAKSRAADLNVCCKNNHISHHDYKRI